MTIANSGTLGIGSSIAAEFGGSTPHALSEYYRSGGLVANTALNAAVPTSGQIKMSQFYGTSNVSFTPVTHTYDTPVNNATETVPSGATSVVIKIWGAGGGGASRASDPTYGGGGGGYSTKTIAVVGGNSLTYTVGLAGAGGIFGVGSAGLDGGTSNCSGTVSGGSVSMAAIGGGGGTIFGVGGGGTASGGTTNTTGSNGGTPLSNYGGASPNGGAANDGAGFAPGGGGGGDNSALVGYNGADGRVEFAYT